MEENIIQFNNKYKVKFCSIIDNDGYLKLTALNALDYSGYDMTEKGVKEFQANNDLEVTGIIDINDFTILIQVFDNDKIQDVLSHLDRELDRAYNYKGKNYIKVAIWLLLLLFFEVWGIVSFALFIYNIIH